MSGNVAKSRARRASKLVAGALAALGVAGASWPAFADERERPALTKLDFLAPSSVTTIDYAPTGALAPPAPSLSRLDLSPPPGMSVELPPEAAAAPSLSEGTASPRLVFDAPPDSPGYRPTPPTVAPPAAVEAMTAPRAEAERSPDLVEVKLALPDAPAAPAAAPQNAQRDVAEARPDLPAPAAVAPLTETPSADAVHAALDAWLALKPGGRPIGAGDWEAARRAIASVYAERNYTPLWIEDGAFSARAKAALARLARADEDGLAPPSLPAQATRAEADVALSAAVVVFALQASGARLVPRFLSKDVTAKPELADPAAALRAVSVAPDADTALEAFNPPHPEYRALRAALAALRGAATPVARVFGGPTLKLGMSDPRVPLIRARFGLGAAPAAAQVYDVKVVSAVAAFQRVHGLSPNGALTEATADALAGGGEALKARRLIANMEMWRWMPRDLGETRVEVNLPEFALHVTSGGQVVHRARVIVGKPDTPTPVFSDTIRYFLVNPAWHVPDSIIKKEMAPRLASDPNYLARRGFKVSYAGDKLVVEQPPGEANALGRMLFLFPNEHAVYLHDTPQRQLFGQSYRALSHGCVRVEDPAALAEILMGGARRGWTQDRIRSLVGDKERTYTLAAPVPVHLEYFTETVDEHGEIQSRDDLYGLTDKVISALSGSRRD